MNQQIAELKDLHVKSKPELQTFLSNANDAIRRRSLPHLIKTMHGVQHVVKGYDWTIDDLFAEIERLEKVQAELTRTIARNLIAWDTSKDKREGLLPEVYLTNKILYKQLTGEEYIQQKAMKKFYIGDDYS
ncbi:hypothetical protein AB4Z21_00935 [Paenibacillus sp. MCAF20]